MRLQPIFISVLCAALMLSMSTVGFAKTAKDTGIAKGGSLIRPVKVEHRFFFRFRPEVVIGGDLGTGVSGVPVPLTSDAAGEGVGSLAWVRLPLHTGTVLTARGS